MFKEVFSWLLNKGIVDATIIFNGISYIVLAIAMFILNWYHKHH
jgi:hypothetical protein